MHDSINQIKPGEIWRHYKGKDYRIIAVSRHSEDLSWYVVYETLYDNPMGTIWHRPLDIFLEAIEVDGSVTKRFSRMVCDEK